MQTNLPRVHSGKQIGAQQRNQGKCRDAEQEEQTAKDQPMMEAPLKRSQVTLAEPFEFLFEAPMKPLKQSRNVSRGGTGSVTASLGQKKVHDQRRDERSREEVGRQHGENDCFGQRAEQEAGHAP